MPLPDVAAALLSFQQALDTRQISIQACVLDGKLFVHVDRPNDETRLTYVRLDRRKVTAMVQFVQAEPYEGEPCFSVGWAVPDALRGEGRAGEAFIVAVKELRHGFATHGMTAFWVEAVVGADNVASQRVAEKVISAAGSKGTDGQAGIPIVQYLRRIDAQTEF